MTITLDTKDLTLAQKEALVSSGLMVWDNEGKGLMRRPHWQTCGYKRICWSCHSAAAYGCERTCR